MKPVASAGSREPPRRVLIIDRRAVTATELCRSLTRRGYAVDILGEAVSPAFHSRFCSRRFPTPPFETGEPFLNTVRDVMGDRNYDAIFVCNEEVLEAIMTLPDYRDWPGLVLSSHSALRAALSKLAMMRLARDAGVAIPRSILLRNENDLAAAADELGFPLIVKGDRGEAGNHVRLVTGLETLFSAYDEISALERSCGNTLLAQEYVKGIGYSVGGLSHEGHVLRVCAHRKLIGVPPLGGMTARGVTERCPNLLEEAFKIFDALKYTGLGHVELIKDENDRFRFLEINPRVWGTIGVAEHADADFFTPYMELARGRIPDPDLRFRENVVFHRIGRELKTIRRRPSRIPGFLRDCLDPRVHSDFEWLDPLPHLAAFATRALRRLTGIRVNPSVHQPE